MTSKPTVAPMTSVSEPISLRKQTSSDRAKIPTPVAAPTHTPPVSSAPPPNQRFRWGWLISLLILAAISGGAWHYQAAWLPAATQLFKGSGPPPRPPARPTPVVTAVVGQRDMNLFLNGLGTVTSLKTVTIRSRVEGEIINVAFSEGQMVHEGRLLAEIDTRPFVIQRDQALGQLERDKAALDIANLNLKRLELLLPKKAVNQQQVDEQLALVKQTEGSIKADQAMVDSAELQLTYCKIVSPITGRIGLRLIDVGNIVRANEANGLAVITQLEPISLVFTIPQDDIPRVQKRMRDGHSLSVDAYDRDFTTKLATGRLAAIDNQVDATTGTLKMKAEFDKNDNVLFPNQFVNTRLLVDVIKDAIVVPSAAVQRGPTSTFVYLVKSDDTVDLRDVVVGPTEGTETSIVSGLAPGEIVVTEGIDKLQPKAKITTREKTAEGADKDQAGSSSEDSKRAKSQPTKPEANKSDLNKSEPSTPGGIKPAVSVPAGTTDAGQGKSTKDQDDPASSSKDAQ